MSIDEAEYILNEAVINEPSISSYTYISAEKINQAIEKILEEKNNNEIKIKQLEENLIHEKNKIEELIKEREREIERKKDSVLTYRNKIISLKKIIKYLKRAVKPVFLLEK